MTPEPTPLVDLSDAALARVQLDDEITRAWEDIDSLLFLSQTALAARHADLAVRASERAVELVRKDTARPTEVGPEDAVRPRIDLAGVRKARGSLLDSRARRRPFRV